MDNPELMSAYIGRVLAARKIVAECSHENCSAECTAAQVLIAEDEQRVFRAQADQEAIRKSASQ